MTVNRTMIIGLFTISIVLASGHPLAAGQYGPGVSDAEIKIGNTMPYLSLIHI